MNLRAGWVVTSFHGVKDGSDFRESLLFHTCMRRQPCRPRMSTYFTESSAALL